MDEIRKRMFFIGWTLFFVSLLVPGIKSEAGGFGPTAVGLEGKEWHLAEVSSIKVSALAGERRPFLKFDAEKKQVTGFAGCNNFFGSYDFAGTSLKFGPVGATRMVCPDLQVSLETEFFKALDQTRAWERRDGLLLLLDGTQVLARFTTDLSENDSVDLQSMAFRSSWLPAGKVTLSRGEYREPAAPGSAAEIIVRLSDKRVFGLINGKETGVALLITDAGGSGTFYDLALLSQEAGGWVNTDIVLLGDRVKVHAIEIAGDAIVIPMKIHAADDPMCCPSREVTRRFTVQGKKLVASAEKSPESDNAGITGPVWRWVQTLYADDRKAAPVEPQNYTVHFREDGTMEVTADCNQKGGTYSASLEEKRLSIEITHSTMATCPEGSLEEEFARGLSAAAIFFITDGDLYIDLKYDSGTMRLSKQQGD